VLPPRVERKFRIAGVRTVPGGSGDRQETIARPSAMIGAMTLARAVSAADPDLAAELPDAARP
jgi:urease accessory protein UreF